MTVRVQKLSGRGAPGRGSAETAPKNNSSTIRRLRNVRRPKVSYESTRSSLDRNELGMFLVQAGIAGGRDHARACMLALNGLRTSQALGADIEHSGMVRVTAP